MLTSLTRSWLAVPNCRGLQSSYTAPSKRRSVSDGGATVIDEYNPTPARISEVVSSVTFCLRIDAGELIELDPILQEIFRGELARIWEVVLRATTRPESL